MALQFPETLHYLLLVLLYTVPAIIFSAIYPYTVKKSERIVTVIFIILSSVGILYNAFKLLSICNNLFFN